MSFPLHTTTFEYDIVRDLVINGADINVKDKNGWTPLDLALCYPNTEQTCILLYALGAGYNRNCWSMKMCFRDDTEGILMIRYNLSPNFRKNLVNYKGTIPRLREGNFPTLSEVCAFELQCAKIRQEIEEEKKKIKAKE